jgi:hypothetical protein
MPFGRSFGSGAVNGQLVRDVRTLLARRQPTLGYLVVLSFLGVGIDLLTAEASDQLSSFSDFSRREFREDVLWRSVAALGHASVIGWVVVLLAVPVSAVLSGWLLTCYLIALGDGHYSWRAPRRTIVQLTFYAVLVELLGLGLSALGDHGQGGILLLILVASMPFTLFAPYAIVFDGVSVVDGLRRSLRMFRVRPRESVLALIVVLLVSVLVTAAFTHGFTDSSHVQPTYLGAWELVGALLVFVTDVVLLTLYRATRLGLSGDGSGDSPEAPSPGEPSD